MNTQLIEAGGLLEAKRTQLMDFYSQFEAVGDTQAKKMTGEDMTQYKALEAEVLDLQKTYEGLKAVHDSAEAMRAKQNEGRNIVLPGQVPAGKIASLGEMFFKDISKLNSTDLPKFAKDYDMDPAAIVRGERKTTMTTAAGYAPEVLRDGHNVFAISRPPQLLDYIPMETTTANSLKWMKETTYTNASTSAAEGSAVAESAFAWTQQTGEINKIGHWLPVTEEQLEDEPGIRSLIENRLVYGVRQELDEQITIGDGTGQDLVGLYALSSIDTQARSGAEPVMDTALKAIKGLRVEGRAFPNLFVFHMTDWVEEIGLARTSDGMYLNGNPTDGMVMRLWGLPVVFSEALTAGNALCLDTNFFILKMRTGVRIAVTDSHASSFTSSVLTFRATVRAGFQSLRDEACCKLTGL